MSEDTPEIIQVVTQPRQPIPPMPKEIAKAIVSVTKKVGKLARDGKNSHGGYKYTSVDAFYEDAAPVVADESLVIYASAIGHQYEKINTDNGLRVAVTVEYTFMLVHAETGATWSDPNDIKQVRMWWTGAQTFGAAESYAIKQFMRGLFKIPTGDRDADEDDQTLRASQQGGAKVNQERKARGKALTSKVVAFDFGHGKEVIAIDEMRERFGEYFESVDNPTLTAWASKNADAIKTLYDYDKRLWNDIRSAIQEGRFSQ